LISFVFFGLPEIEQNLKLDAPLAQRVAMRYRLEPFSADATEAYVKHRLRLAGCAKNPFTAEAIQVVHRRSGGTPRVINTLCDNALFEGFLNRSAEIGGALIEQIADNLGLESGRAPAPATAPAAPLPPAPPLPAAPASSPVMAPYRSAAPFVSRREPVSVGPEPPGNSPATESVAPVQPAASAVPQPALSAPQAGAAARPRGSVDLAEIDRYLEGLGKL
jgi:hypothetical protein